MKIAHISDVHIRNYRYHKEYEEVFNQIYEILKKEKPDIIVNTGDTCHTKLQISPSYVDVTSRFFKNLADIAPYHIILGNHDLNLRNLAKTDSISPIVDALEHPNIYIHKYSGVVSVSDEVDLHVLSICDEENWKTPEDNGKVSVALFHGSVAGVETDMGWMLEHGEIDLSYLDNFDYALLGDIHKTNQSIDTTGKKRYPGSLIQQNHGETNDKGFLMWDIQSKENFSVKHVSVPNPKPFITVELTPKGKLPRKVNVPENSRLRVVSRNNLPLDVLKKSVEVAKTRFKPESVTFLNKSMGTHGDVDNLASNIEQENLRDLGVQEKFIREYLKDYNPDEGILTKVLELNKKYNAVAEEGEDVIRNINWNVNAVEWDNLFNYGEGNKIKFENLEGIVGIFGKNYSGKSSVIDSLLYTLFDKTSKNNRKNLDVINQNKDYCRGKVGISIGDKHYTIDRNSEKYERTLHGKTTTEAKTDVNFKFVDNITGDEEELNGATRQATDKKIRKVFGTYDDFLLTSMASQIDSLSYIKEGSVKRKEILAKFLDLEIFDKKYKLAKEESAELRSAIKRLEEKDFGVEIEETEVELEENGKLTKIKKKECSRTKDTIEGCNEDLAEINRKIDSIPAEVIDYDEVQKDLETKQNEMNNAIKENQAYEDKIKKHKKYLEKVENLKTVFNIEECIKKKEIIIEHQKEIDSLASTKTHKDKELKGAREKIKLLEEVPCGSEYSSCKFIKNAYLAIEEVDIIGKVIAKLEGETEEIEKKIKSLDPETVEEYIEKYNDIIDKEQETSSEISDLSLRVERNKSLIIQLQLAIDTLNIKLFEYEANKEAIENLEKLIKEKRKINTEIKAANKILGGCEEELLNLHKIHGSLEQKLQNLYDQKEELNNLREDYSAYDLYEKCMRSKDGIPYDIIKNKLPVINEEISKILSNIVDFEIFFETSDKKLDINIKHSKYEARPIELGSGAEKTIASMAIRLALLSVSNLPKANLFVLDEPGTALDEENMEGFVRILTDMIKTQFKTVILISHLDSLKDCVDMTIEIDKVDGLAYINQ